MRPVESRMRELLQDAASAVPAPLGSLARVRSAADQHERRATAVVASALATSLLAAAAGLALVNHSNSELPTVPPPPTIQRCSDPCWPQAPSQRQSAGSGTSSASPSRAR